ncbi:sigma-54 interaction domain-containing protein [Thermohalobacter berrensis]|uniref:Sigma-54-dependent Fis family transcriptional regulator n=1 Tax=Thermohalobacter berrensis TaxID=99594 RepID=A0A419SXW3_9FIRM|nr:sigma-54-dependent Fis family transcriptional regulator [Thermohalobacter berrensis]RKD29999.1 sigma-54-dependent Fis family transcriptional regulator [Thermohalobacter berrensis]
MRKELEVILNSTHDGMIAVNKDGIITLFNKAAEKLTGINMDYALGKPVKEVIQNTRLPYILKTGDLELNRQQDLGNIKIITNRMPVKDEKGQIIGAVAVFRDITEILDLAAEITNLKEIQSMLEGVFNSTQDAISVVDKKGINVMINPAYTELTGLSEEDIIGQPATADIAEGESIHMKVLKTKKPVKNARLKVGPNKREVLATAAPIMVDGELRGSVGVLHDVSEIIKLNKELKEAKKLIRKLEAKYTFDDIVGNNELIDLAIEKAKKAATTPATVILRGESGTGKELFAHAIHNESDRKFNQFVRVNCAAISESLLESELFGYEEGAFTGAKKGGKKGLFEQANRGTIFLDEIGEISLSTQAKLLRVLQEKEIVRVGGTKPISIDVRIIAATNIDLEKAVKEGKFREDLYYRLNVFPIYIPALRYRKDDIYPLVLHFIKKFNQEYGRSITEISEGALRILKKHDWPGNVRELENVIGRAIINMKHNETVIEEEYIPKIYHYSEKSIDLKDDLEINFESKNMSLKDVIKNTERQFIKNTLKRFGFNKTKAAKALGISIRSLYYKIDKYGIEE